MVSFVHSHESMPRKHGSRVELLEKTLNVLLAVAAENCEEFVKIGGITTILKAMRTFKDECLGDDDLVYPSEFEQDPYADVQSTALQLLTKLCAEEKKQAQSRHKKLIVEAGGIEDILDALREFPTDNRVYEEACRTLIALASDEREYQNKIVKAGGIKLIFEPMEVAYAYGNIHFLCMAFDILNILLENPDNSVFVFEAGDTTTLIGMTKKALKYEDRIFPELTVPLKTRAMMVLNHLLNPDAMTDSWSNLSFDMQQQFVQDNGIKDVLKMANKVLDEERNERVEAAAIIILKQINPEFPEEVAKLVAKKICE